MIPPQLGILIPSDSASIPSEMWVLGSAKAHLDRLRGMHPTTSTYAIDHYANPLRICEQCALLVANLFRDKKKRNNVHEDRRNGFRGLGGMVRYL